MYKEIDAAAVRSLLAVDEQYRVNALITYGTHPKTATESLFQDTLEGLYPESQSEPAFTGFFQDIKSYRIGDTRIWFCVVYGGALTSEIVHIAALLGATTILHGGSGGALEATLNIGSLFLPESSASNDSCARLYQRDGEHIHRADPTLRDRVAASTEQKCEAGTMLSIQAMLGETREDIEEWSQLGYRAVDLETATVFAVSNHFKVPAATLLYVSDNLVTEELVHQSTEEHRTRKADAKKAVLTSLIKTARRQ